MVVCSRKEFDKDLSYDTNTRFLLITDRNQVKLMHHFVAHFFELAVADTAALQEGNDSLLPDLMFTIDDSRLQLIWTHTINTFHQNISEYRTITYSFDKRKCQFESRVAFQSTQIDGNNRNLLHAGLLECTADKCDIVGRTASTTCLRHDDSRFVQVILAGKKRIHNLSDYHQRRIAGIIIYIFQSHIDCMLIIIRKDFQMISTGIKCSLQDSEMER